jgi:hypothetical protein
MRNTLRIFWRVIINLITSLSLLLALLALFSWVRSHRHCDEFYCRVETVVPETNESARKSGWSRTSITTQEGSIRYSRFATPIHEVWDGPESGNIERGWSIDDPQ